MFRKEFEQILNEIGCPKNDHPENNGRCTWAGVQKYGSWLRRNDPIAFNVAYNENEQEEQNV